MHNDLISLPSVIPGREYIINHIENGKSHADGFRGYGIFPGSRIKLVFTSPSKDPSAYEVMGAVLALRCEDCKNIYVSPVIIHHPGHTLSEP